MTTLVLLIGLTGVALGVILHALARYQKAKKEANRIAEEFVNSLVSSFKEDEEITNDEERR
jgi:uncharacterized protein YejL (UPF0352 family)